MSLSQVNLAEQRNEIVPLWPGVAPGEKGDIGEEKDTTKVGADGKREDDIIRLGNVTRPNLTIYRPTPATDTGSGIELPEPPLPEPLVKPILIGADGEPPAERKRGWWRR